MNRLSVKKRKEVLHCLLEGTSIRSTCRLVGVSKNTVIKLMIETGKACRAYQDEHLKNLSCKRIQCDEIWSFCHTKEKNLPILLKGSTGVGDVWTWTSFCPDTKIVPFWLVGKRDNYHANIFMLNLKQRLTERVQLTTDGFKSYYDAVPNAFGADVDFATLVKVYGEPIDGKIAVCIGTDSRWIIGRPDDNHVSTSLCERQNLSMRMMMRRFTRKTNGFSKKIDNHISAVDLYFMYYNFIREHQTLKTTPAIAAGVTTRRWTLNDLAKMAM